MKRTLVLLFTLLSLTTTYANTTIANINPGLNNFGPHSNLGPQNNPGLNNFGLHSNFGPQNNPGLNNFGPHSNFGPQNNPGFNNITPRTFNPRF